MEGGGNGEATGGRALETADESALDHGQPVDSDGAMLSVVKMKLDTFIKDQRLAQCIRSLVSDVDRLVAEAYMFANLHVLRLLDQGKQLPLLDRNFYYRCLIAVSKSKSKTGTLSDDFLSSIQAFDALRPADGSACKIDTAGCNQVVADMSITMATMASNHLWMNLDRRLERYLVWSRPELKAFHKAIVRAVAVHPNKKLETLISAKPKKARKAKAAKGMEGAEAKAKEVKAAKGKKGAEAKAKEAKAAEVSARLAERAAQARSLAAELRAVAPLPGIASRWACRAVLTIPLYRKILRETEQALAAHKAAEKEAIANGDARAPKRFPGRTFNLLPTKRGYTAAFVPISSMMLKALLKRMGLEQIAGDGRSVEDRPLWTKYFNLNAVETRARKFGDRICTDGYAVGVLMRVTCGRGSRAGDADLEEVQRAFGKEDVEVTGVDPGISDVFVGVSTSGRAVSMSSKEYYHLSKVNYSNQIIRQWNSETQHMDNDALQGRGKTSDANTLAAYTAWYLRTLPAFLEHRTNKGYRKLRFLRYCKKQQAIEEMCERLAPRECKLVIMGFGDWAGPKDSPISRKTVGPIQELKKALQRRRNVLFRHVDEYKTSRTCSDTLRPLVNMKVKKTSVGENAKTTTHKIHKVLHCRNSDGRRPDGCKQTTWNRDVNAARNMLTLLLAELRGLPRPEAFRRPTKACKQE